MTSQPFRLVPSSELPLPLHLLEGEGSSPTHAVQFYENDHFLAAAVADFLAAGIMVGQPIVVIATAEHRDAFLLRLKSKGLDTDYAARSGYLTMLDASEMLAHFMDGALPDPVRFKATVGSVIDNSLRASSHRCIRAYGEMVDLLWKDGNTEGAIRLEEMWNDLAATHSFSLLCAYSMGNFYKEAQSQDFRRICHAHASVIPAESFTDADESARLLEIALLQQRAKTLEHEIEHRRKLEERLRDALSERDRLLASEQASRAEAESARAEAEAANRAKSDFLAVMSHELRTPLNAIGGHVQLVEMGVHGPVTEAQRDALVRVERSQRHLLSLINDVLNLVKIESGRIDYDLVDVSLPAVVADVKAMVDPLLDANELSFAGPAVTDSSGSAATPIVLADRDKVQQIVLNLVTNAIKFTPPGGQILIEAAPCNDDPAMACIRVSDTGIGIASEKLERIFEPFVQLASRPTSGQDGLGLGLAISRDLARGMGGDLSVSSGPAKGATFLLKLPLA